MTAPGYQPVPAPPPHDWSQYNLDQIWTMLSTHSEASADIASDMWRRIGELCYAESTQLELALTKLHESWPLTQPAAILFHAWGQQLIQAMRATAANSIGNQLTLLETTGWIGTARKRILELRYKAGEYRAMLDDAAKNDPWAAAGAPDTRPHPPAGWYEDLSQQAQEIMAELEVRVFHSAMRGEIDKPFDGSPPYGGHVPGATELGGGGGFSGAGGGISFVDLPQPQWPEDLGLEDRQIDDPILDRSGGLGGMDPATGLPLAAGALPHGETPIGRMPASGGMPSGTSPAGYPMVAGTSAAGVTAAAGTGAGAPSRGLGAGMVPFMPPMVPPGARAASDPNGAPPGPRAGRRARSASVFETPTASDGVLRPEPEARPEDFDPGPGVIGIDR